jgi:hypothetical protein
VITRIRIEAEADTKELVISELDTAAQRVMTAVGGTSWECMDDVVVANRRHTNEIIGYKGRRVYHYQGKGVKGNA